MTQSAFKRSAAGIAIALAFAIAPAQSFAAALSESTWPRLTDSATSGPRRFITSHRGRFNGQSLRYQATVEETLLKDAKGQPASSVFNISYVRTDVPKTGERPIVFIFNGGPGGASDSLHLGAFGPKRMASFTPAAQADPKTQLVDNPYSLIDAADLVFIDPPETGYGEPLPGSDPKTFRSIDGDSYATGQFILHWLSENHRASSPIYIAGESYGGHRAVALARDLANATPAIRVNGLILISQALLYNGETETSVAHLPDPLQRMGRLQDAVALAWYHGKIDNRSQSLRDVIAKARQFTLNEWAPALLQGGSLSEADRQRIAGRLQDLTGISSSAFLANDLKVPDLRKELLRDRGQQLDQFDGRAIALPEAAKVDDRHRDWDAAFAGVTASMMRYATQDLGVRGLGAYKSIVHDPYGFEDTWAYLRPPASGLDVVLSEQLKAQPQLRVLVPMGLFDTTSSAGSAPYFFGRFGATDRITLRYYNGGHMPYASLDGLRAFNADVRAFVSGHPLESDVLPDLKPAQ